ncbi:MAG: DUF1059 domain-containing protein [Candidatus Rokubacteria bacterium]|nr:DUF1059 domain-containing protein [Candidatus Rokubacteria bacterium]
MEKQIRCADLMPGCRCGFVVTGKDADEIVALATLHARRDHGMATIPPGIIAKLRAAVEGSD